MRLFIASIFLGIITSAHAAPLTTGNLVISRTGDGTTAIGSAASQVSLVEIMADGTPTGNLVSLPTQSTANAGGLTDSGSASSNGHLNRSADGRYLMLTGYDAPLGTASVTGSTSLAVNRNVARVDAAGTVSVLARLSDAFSANNVRSATSDAGSTVYVAGNPGVRWADASSSVPTTSTAIVAASSHRDVLIAQDATGAKFLLVSTSTGISAFTGFPTATAAPTSLGITLTDPHAFMLLDRSPTVGATNLGGLDTLYVADGSGTGGSATAVLRKYEWSGSAWAAAGTATMTAVASKLFGLTARVADSGGVELYATTAINSNNSLVTITDGSNGNAFGGSLSGTLSVLASAGANYAFRGVAFAPVTDLSINVLSAGGAFTTVPFSVLLTAANNGPANAQNVGVQFTLPAGLTFVSASGDGFTASHSNGVVTFAGGAINASSSVPLTVVVKASSAGTYDIPAGAAVIDPANAVEESNESNNTSAAASGTPVLDAPDLMVSVSAPTSALTGSSGFDFTVTPKNVGLANAYGVTMRFTVPDGLTVENVSGGNFGSFNVIGNVINFTGGNLDPDESDIITVSVSASSDGTITVPAGAAIMDPAHAVAESDITNNTSAAISDIVITTSDLTISNTHNDTFQAGDPAATYTLTVGNVGTGTSSGLITVSDTLPTGLTATSLAGTGWTVVQGTGSSVSATRSDALAAGASYPALTLTCSIALNTQASVTNSATVSGGGDHSTSNNTATDDTPILGAGPGVIAFGPPPLLPYHSIFTVNEEAGSISIPIVRTSGRTGSVSVKVNSTDGNATSPADYGAVVNQVITFADNEVQKTVTVNIVRDSIKEGDHFFTLTLSSPTGGATLGISVAAYVYIIDPDTSKPTVSIISPTVNERIEGPVFRTLILGTALDGLNGSSLFSLEGSMNGGPWVRASKPLGAPPPSNYNYEVELGVPNPGSNTVSVRAIDFRGNTTLVSRPFTYVLKKPLSLTTLPSASAGTVTIAPKETLTSLELAKSYTLTAKPNKGYRWDHWTTPSGDVEASTLMFTMSDGLAITANFVADSFQTNVIGEFNGLIMAAGGVAASNSTNGFINVKLTSSSSFTGSIKIDGLKLPFTGALDNAGVARFGKDRVRTLSLVRANKPALILAFQADLAAAGTHKLTGTLDLQTPSGSTAMSIIDADRAAFDGKTPGTTTVAANYTAALSGGWTNPEFSPQGDGIATITVGKDGKFTLVGTLADGTAFTSTVPMSAARTAPVYAALYKNRGCIGAVVALDETQPNSDLSSTSCWWFRPFITGSVLPQGWPNGLSPHLVGAKYAVSVGESVLRDLDPVPSPNATLTFTDGGLAARIDKPLAISKTNAVIKVEPKDASFTLKLTAATGKLSGSFTHSDGKRTAFNGIVLQKGGNRRGFGYFVGSSLAGAVALNYTQLPHPTVVITELMAKNVTSITDEDGAHSDWIELYNPGADPIDLTNWCLTDNDTNLTKWRFPAVTLNSKEFLVVWASSKNRRVPGSPLHTNFSLSNSGEYLALVRPDGVTIEQEFAPTFPALRDDESYGVNFIGASLAVQGAAARYLVPTNAALGTTWTNTNFSDSSWRSGKTGIGFGMTVPGMTVRHVAAKTSFVGVDSLAKAESVIALPKGNSNLVGEATVIAPSLNYLGDGADGHYDSNAPLPYSALENYVIHATGIINIPAAGSYVFGLNSDDGGRIKIDGNDVMVDDTNHGSEDHLSAPITLSAGAHTVDVIMWEGGGGDELEFFASAGTATSWDDSFKLVGGPGGLPVFTTPLSNGSNNSVVNTNVQSLMLNKNATCYARVPFTASDVATLSGLTLNMRYNDGFIAYLNGTEIARRNAPPAAVFNSAATASRSVIDTLTTENIDVSAYRNLLVNGRNILAIHGMNDSAADAAFLVLPELLGTGVLRSATAVRYSPGNGSLTATPGSQNGVPLYSGLVADTSFSVKRGIYSSAFSLAITSPTPGAQIRYTLDGSTPSATKGTLYTGPIRISRTSVVRALAFKAGWEPTNVDTHSYFFFDDVIRQQPTGARPSAAWAADGVNGQAASYGMDPAIVNSKDSNIGGATMVKEGLAALPTMSLVTDLPNLFDPATGIYVNPGARGFDWEKPASLEMIGDKTNASGGFHVNCGVRVRGGYSRSGDNPKHSFHIYFRSQYGDAELKYPLFGSSGASSFAQIDFRTAQNYSWSFGGDGNNTFMREETSRELQVAMGQPGSRDRYFHLYINGVYWGLFDLDERTEASFASTYLGGNKADYDVVKCEQDQGYITGVTDGNLDAWQQLWNAALAHATDPSNANYFALQGKAADGVTPTSDPVLLDVDNMIDYMLLTFWTGNLDGCTSAFLGEANANNWFGARDRTGANGGFRFFVHDFEHTFFNPDEDRTGPFTTGYEGDFTRSNPMWIHHNLRSNAEYKMRWADRVQKHMFNNGALVGDTILQRIQRRKAELDKAIIAESARWGDAKRAATDAPLTRHDWLGAVSYITDSYLPIRGSRVLQQLRDDGLYPSFDPPTLSQFGGRIATGTELMITGHGGTIYYTLDGADPRQIGGALNPSAQVYTSATTTETIVPATQTWRYLGDGSDQGTAWRAASFDDSAWLSGPAELGYGDGDETTTVPFFDTDSVTAGDQKNATTYFRSSFTVTNVSEITAATISLKYDDAAIVYVNGVEAMHTDNIASNAAFNQYASGATPDEGGTFDFSISPSLLVNGSNSIAVEIHQASPDSSDISFQLALNVTRTSTPSPLILSSAGTHRLQVRALNGSNWSALVDATYTVFSAPDLSIAAVANGQFNVGDVGKTLTYTVTNVGTAKSDALGGFSTQVRIILPAGLTATGISGTGWSLMNGQGSRPSVVRYDALAAGSSFPPITLTVDVGNTAANTVSTSATATLAFGDSHSSNDTAITTIPIFGAGTQELFWSSQGITDSPDLVNEEDGSINVTINRRGHISGTASVTVSTVNGTAKAPADFDAIADQTITFADGETTKVVTVGIHDDTAKEGNEQFTLVMSNPVGATIFNASNTVTIIDHDTVAPAVTIVSPASNAKTYAVLNGGTINVMVKATDNYGVKRVEGSINGGPFVAGDYLNGSITSGIKTGTWRLSPFVNPGDNTLTVRAVDYRGNISKPVTRSFIMVPSVGLQLLSLPDGLAGTVASTPALPALDLAEIGKNYILTPTANTGFRFDHWLTPNGIVESPTLSVTPITDSTIQAVFVPNPFVAAVLGDYNGLIRNVPAVTRSNANNGFINIKPTSTGAFTGKLKIDGDVLSLSGQFKNNGTCTLIVNRLNKTPLQLDLTLDLQVNGTHKITGTVSEITRDATTLIGNVDADRAYFDGKAHVATKISYKVRVPALPANPLYPAGEGSGTLSIATSGVVTLAMKLADNTSFTTTAPMSEARTTPLFASLYRPNKGCFFANIALALPLPINNLLSPDALWIRPYIKGNPLPFGWPDGVTVQVLRVP